MAVHQNSALQVAEGLRRFGISAKSTSAILVRIGPKLSFTEKKALQDEMQYLTGGKPGSLDDLAKTADLAALKKVRVYFCVFITHADADLYQHNVVV